MIDFMNMKQEKNKKHQMPYNNSSLQVLDAALESNQVRLASLKTFEPSYASSKAKYYKE